jgi:hypothetical protein
VGIACVNWMDLAQDKDKYCALVSGDKLLGSIKCQ